MAAWAASIRTIEPKRKRWLFPRLSEETEQTSIAIAESMNVARPVAELLMARGCLDIEQARRFLCPTLAELHSPSELRDMAPAVDRILFAIHNAEAMEIHGDYDVDGTTSTVILKTAIELAGGKCTFCIPHRLRDGYGIQLAAVERAAEAGVRLIVSVDTGIRATAVVRRAAELGIDVIVTDHHLPEECLPPAIAVINPNRTDCHYPNKNLCGVGVAFKLVEALLSRLGWAAEKLRRILDSFLKLVALGTVADVVPLLGENRAIVKHGLEGLRTVTNAGLRALLDSAGIEPGKAPSARQVGFQIAPRINAAGRMASAEAVIELFFTRDTARATTIAEELQRLNMSRQAEEAGIVEEILNACSSNQPAGYALVFSAPGWHRGVLGIVASRLVERFHRPCFVLGEENGEATGSGRSIPGFHLLDGLDSMRELFRKYGGHSHAAGLTIPSCHVEEFRERLNLYAGRTLTEADLTPCLEIDAKLQVSELDDRFYRSMRALEPFGAGNPAPVFAAFHLEVAGEPRFMKEKHLRVNLRSHGRQLTFKGFHFAGRADELVPGSFIDAAFCLEEDRYTGGWAAILKDIRPSERTSL